MKYFVAITTVYTVGGDDCNSKERAYQLMSGYMHNGIKHKGIQFDSVSTQVYTEDEFELGELDDPRDTMQV